MELYSALTIYQMVKHLDDDDKSWQKFFVKLEDYKEKIRELEAENKHLRESLPTVELMEGKGHA